LLHKLLLYKLLAHCYINCLLIAVCINCLLITHCSVLFMWYCSSTAVGSLPRAVTMSDDIEAAALRARLEAIVKEAEDAEAQATAARRRVQAARLLLDGYSCPSARAIFVFIVVFLGRGLAARPHRLFGLRRYGRRRTSPSGGRSAQRPPAGEHRPRLLLHQLRQLV
jgi:hypothetical protein